MNVSQDRIQCTHSCPSIDITIYVKNWKYIEVQVPKEHAYP
jgi:hypothetical protein